MFHKYYQQKHGISKYSKWQLSTETKINIEKTAKVFFILNLQRIYSSVLIFHCIKSMKDPCSGICLMDWTEMS